MADAPHRLLADVDMHSPFRWVYADAAARTSDTTSVVGDVNKTALQLSDYTEWLLVSAYVPAAGGSPAVPAAWSPLGAPDSLTAASVSYDNTTSGLPGTNVQEALDELAATETILTGSVTTLLGIDAVLSGLAVWSLGGYNFAALPGTALIGGVVVTSPGKYNAADGYTPVTLAAADPALDRIDIIAENRLGVVEAVTGTPALPPLPPNLVPSDGVGLVQVLVKAGSSSPVAVNNIAVYADDSGAPTEWAVSSPAPSFNAGSTTNPFGGTGNAIRITAGADGDSITLSSASPVTLVPGSVLLYDFAGNTGNAAIDYLAFQFQDAAGTNVGLHVSGLVNAAEIGYQTVVVPLSLARLTGPVSKLVISVVRGGTPFSGDLDNITLQTGLNGVSSGGLSLTVQDTHGDVSVNPATMEFLKATVDSSVPGTARVLIQPDASDVVYDPAVSGLAATTIQAAADELQAEIVSGATGGTGDGILFGCTLTNTDPAAFEYAVSAGTYVIDGTLYATAGRTFTLAAADSTYDRIDVVYLDVYGNVTVLTGTPADPAAEPELIGGQLRVSAFDVPANATAPVGSVIATLYNEGAAGEWTVTTPAPARILIGDTSDAFNGTHQILLSASVHGDQLKFQPAELYSAQSGDVLTLAIKNDVVFPANMFLKGWAKNAANTKYIGTPIYLRPGAFGFDAADLAWQSLSINMTAFGGIVNAGSIVFSVGVQSGTPVPLTLGLDLIQLKNALGSLPGGGYVLPPANVTSLGGVKVGAGLSVTPDGTLSTVFMPPDLDGGAAHSVYLPAQSLSGGASTSIYTSSQNLNGGNS